MLCKSDFKALNICKNGGFHSGDFEDCNFWDVTPCSLFGRCPCFGGNCGLRLQGRKVTLKMEAAGLYEVFLSTQLLSYMCRDTYVQTVIALLKLDMSLLCKLFVGVHE